MSSPNPIGGIVSPNGPDITVTITLDTKTNQTMCMTNKPVNQFILAGMLMEHALGILRKLMVESAKKSTIEGIKV
jgi:hypothetical protein